MKDRNLFHFHEGVDTEANGRAANSFGVSPLKLLKLKYLKKETMIFIWTQIWIIIRS